MLGGWAERGGAARVPGRGWGHRHPDLSGDHAEVVDGPGGALGRCGIAALSGAIEVYRWSGGRINKCTSGAKRRVRCSSA